ncbi:hypothetical protein H206_02669 [Candidatus Electrothrix aarhusensis]|uniref:Uncharacterized protein n=1 Tax=Candidatus Electrothrix aarhusensis TaxID=1859131 RepID=A0A444IXJ5_9BACT|nr:hypothetical protein H206_02669 [Candidatus Electrothrix aarhusensis]
MIDTEDILKAIWHVLKMFIFMFLVNIVFYYLGFIVLKIVTLWKYPTKEMTKKDENIVICTGAIMPFFIFACFFIVNNYIA